MFLVSVVVEYILKERVREASVARRRSGEATGGVGDGLTVALLSVIWKMRTLLE